MTGYRKVEGGDLIRIKFDLQTIKADVKRPEDVDGAKRSFVPNITHCECWKPEAYFSIIVRNEGSQSFNSTVYFHPNFDVEGWERLRALHSAAKAEWEEEKATHLKKVMMKKSKKERKKDQVKEEADMKKYNRTFPGFPDKPKFWTLDVVGSSVFLWPPKCIAAWAEDVKNGKSLCLAPARPTSHLPPSSSTFPTNAVAGPSSGPKFNSMSKQLTPPPISCLSGTGDTPSPPASISPPPSDSGDPEGRCDSHDQVANQLVRDQVSEDEYKGYGIPDDVLALVKD